MFFGKKKIALIMRRDRHDRAGAVVHQDIIGNPNRDFLAVDRVDCILSGKNPFLLFIA